MRPDAGKYEELPYAPQDYGHGFHTYDFHNRQHHSPSPQQTDDMTVMLRDGRAAAERGDNQGCLEKVRQARQLARGGDDRGARVKIAVAALARSPSVSI